MLCAPSSWDQWCNSPGLGQTGYLFLSWSGAGLAGWSRRKEKHVADRSEAEETVSGFCSCQHCRRPGIGTRIQGRVGCEGAGEGGCSGRLGRQRPQASLGSHLCSDPEGTGLGSSFCRKAGQPRLTLPVPAMSCPVSSPRLQHPGVPQDRTGRSNLHFLSLSGKHVIDFQLPQPEEPRATLGPHAVPRSYALLQSCPFPWALSLPAGSSHRCK